MVNGNSTVPVSSGTSMLYLLALFCIRIYLPDSEVFRCQLKGSSLIRNPFFSVCIKEQPLLIQDLLEQEKREQQQQQPGNNMLLGQQQQHPLMHDQTPPGDPLMRSPMMATGHHPAGVMRQYSGPGGGGMHPMMGPRLAAPLGPGVVGGGGGWPPRHPQEVTLQQRSPHQMMAQHQVQ